MKNVKIHPILFVLLLTSFLVWPVGTIAADETAEMKKQIEVLTNRVAQLEKELQRHGDNLYPAGYPLLPRWDPAGEIQRIQSEMNRLFQESMSRAPLAPTGMMNSFDLKFDFAETKTHYIYTFDIPGVNKENIKLDVRDRMLTIAGERTESSEESQGNQVRRSRSVGTFSKTISLPPDSNENEIAADYDKGVLTVKVGRKPHSPAPKPAGKIIKVN